ncbi:MAG: TonB-dependent receptor [Lunatimonas sp.]|uniref:TonB-dependent receptor domain-containing protein n=1 Tax=Lunatimonas sp. TaxID=2060141 RepID=UPI00263A8098|nr:TonB-dependent receptor [Lunatimonas sp.]MCC5937182.1 TonB-dependent receptor [Lunatimonas sp.]
MKKSILTVVMSFALVCMGLAQSQTLTGRVISADEPEGIPGANVSVKGSTLGTVTDLNGRYSLTVPDGYEIVIFSFVGYTSQEILISNRSTIDVTLVADIRMLEEIVVTGQGEGIEKRRLPITVDRMTEEDIYKVPVVQLDQILRSNMPNAQIRLGSGQPGTASFIRSRGPVSAAVGTTPVIYVDGVRVDNLNSAAQLSLETGGAQSSAIADIPVENIESIEYVKGGAATTLYGADAANGVIQIFTKKGKQGQARVNLETQHGAQVGTRDYLFFQETADILFRPGLQQSYRLGIDGGTENLTYSFSGNLYGDESFRYGVGQIRRNFRGGIMAKVNNWITYQSSAGFSSNQFSRDYNANSSFSEFGNLETVARWGDLTTKSRTQLDSISQVVRSIIDLTNITERVRRFQNSHQFNFKFNEELSARAIFGIDSRNSRQRDITTNQQLIVRGNAPAGTNDRGTIDVFERSFFTLTGQADFTWKKDLKDFSFLTIAGGQFFRNQDEQLLIEATNVTEGSISINNAGEKSVEDFLLAVTNYGFFLKENLGIRDKIFVEGGIRVDGNTAFGSDIGLQVFPTFGVAYNLSDETFFRNTFSMNTLSTVKFRANHGVAGNFPEPFRNDRLINTNTFLGVPTYTFGNPGDPTLKPERTATTELGGDVGFFTDRIKLQVTRYHALTRDALFSAPFAPSFGLGNQLRNIGEIENKGWEIGANFVVVESNDWTVNVSASYNTVNNTVLSSGGAPEFNVGGFTFLGSFVKEGEPLGYFRANRPILNAEGQLERVETNASVGSPIAPTFGSLSINTTYKRFNLFITGDYQTGGHTVAVDDVLRYFAGASTVIPDELATVNFFDLAALWVQSSDYLKIRNIALSYDVPTSVIGSAFKRMSVGFNITNPINFFRADVDPEVSGVGFGTQNSFGGGGFGFGTESLPRTYLGTVRISF